MLDSAKLENIVPNVRKLPKKILWGETVDKITEKKYKKTQKKGMNRMMRMKKISFSSTVEDETPQPRTQDVNGTVLEWRVQGHVPEKAVPFPLVRWAADGGGGVEKGLSLQCLHTGSSMATQSWASPFSLSDTHRCIGCWQPSSECPEYLQKKQC